MQSREEKEKKSPKSKCLEIAKIHTHKIFNIVIYLFIKLICLSHFVIFKI